MSTLSSLLILSALSAPANEGKVHPTRDVDAVEIFSCTFNDDWDVNYDDWPDRWKRITGVDMPSYVKASLEDDPTALEGRCLSIQMNGGSTLIQSPSITISEYFSYIFEAQLRIVDLKYGKVQLVVEFTDDDRNVLQTTASKWYTSTNGWTKVRIGPINPLDSNARWAQIHFRVKEGRHPDLQGKVSLDDIWLARMPRMTVETNSPFNVYTDPHDIMVTCSLMGILEKDPDIHFELFDASSRKLEDDTIQLDGRLITERLSRASDIVDNSTKNLKAGYAGKTQWPPPIDKYGFYRVRVTMRTSQGMMNQHIISIAVVPPLEKATQGEFGWTLTSRSIPLSFNQLTELLPLVAINWVKLPVWYDPSQPELGDKLVQLTEHLSAKDIEVVGVVDHPPVDSELGQHLPPDTNVADLLSLDPDSWLPSLDPVLTRLSMRVRWWQLGKDHDVSFSGFAQLEEVIAKLRDKLFRFGQDIRLGIGWQWPNGDGLGQPASWNFQQYTATPSLTQKELAAYLQIPRRPQVDRWVLVEPLSQELYDLPIRVHDLVGQMLTAKIHEADAIFIAEPFNDDHGLLSMNGSPGELLLPWRTTASLLSGTKHLGSLHLPQGSENHLFEAPNGSVLMVVWNEKPVQEVLYLGDNTRIIDVWGRAKKPKNEDYRQVVDVDTLPQFVLGIDPNIARWRLQVQFKNTHFPSVFGQSHPNQIRLHNHFLQGAGGTAHLIAPEGWQVLPETVEFKLAAQETSKRPFEIALPFDANSGNIQVRIDFVVAADREYRFSVYRELSVGVGDVEIDVDTRLDDNGTLIVEQRMVNHSGNHVDFKCLLYAQGQRRQRKQVFQLGDNQDTKVYYYPHGEDLLGTELWLRAEELDGSRVLNHRFTAER
jgi:hypothetical protein